MPLEPTPLFRPQVIRPRVRELEVPIGALKAREKLHGWASNLAGPLGPSATETALLPDYLTVVFQEILGYRGWAERSDGAYTIHREKLVEVDGKFADAVLGRFTDEKTDPVVAVEGKGPRDPLGRPYAGRKMSAVDQAYRYAINLPADWVIVTNLREIRLYHKGATQRSFERFALRELAEKDDEFRRFVFVLGAERVVPAQGRSHLYELLEDSEKAGDRLTQEFYRTYAGIRHDLLGSLLDENPTHDPAAVLSAAQQLLDRTLFIAFAEDRGLLPSETLARAYEHHDPYNPRPVWENFRGLFRAIDQGNPKLGVPQYNGGLFREDRLLDHELEVPDESCELLKTIGDYHYGHPAEVEGDEEGGQIVDVEILGHIFEQSIEDLEAIRAEIEGGETSRQLSKRKREGAFYTPTFITQYIVGRSLRPVLDERFEKLRAAHQDAVSGTAVSILRDPRIYDVEELNNPQRDALIAFWEAWIEELKTIRALDPACGSGAFLIELFDQLHVEYQQAGDRLAELRRGGWAGSLFDPDRTILQHNLYGVDLNEEAIEIARLSVWIKTAQRGKILTDLDHNIRVGNSVVSDPGLDPKAFAWWQAFPEVAEQGGFDVVVGNPPYVRAEMLTEIKPHLQEQYDTYHGVADLYVYFFELGARLLRPGGRLAYIVTNKWLKAGYAAPLRQFFSDDVWVEEVVDLGHAKGVFPDADVFPSLVRVQKPMGEGQASSGVSISSIPRDDVQLDDLRDQIAARAFTMPQELLDPDGWNLEPPEVAKIIAGMRSQWPPLTEYTGGIKPYRGVVTGCNKVFLVDQATRDRLVAEHPSADEIIRPYLRGQDVERWHAVWPGEWMIFTRRGVEIERYPSVLSYLKEHRDRLEPKPADWEGDRWPGRKGGNYEWYEIQDTIQYHEEFARPKIIYQEIQYHPSYALDYEGIMMNNKCFMIPTDDPYLLAVLNSPLMWWFNWRELPHMKDEALSPVGYRMEEVPIARPSPQVAEETSGIVDELVRLTRTRQDRIEALLDWLRMEFNVKRPGRNLSSPDKIDSDQFVAEVKDRRSGKSAVSSGELKRLRAEHQDVAPSLRRDAARMAELERQLSDLVNSAYRLTEEEMQVVRRTAPPRMPISISSDHLE